MASKPSSADAVSDATERFATFPVPVLRVMLGVPELDQLHIQPRRRDFRFGLPLKRVQHIHRVANPRGVDRAKGIGQRSCSNLLQFDSIIVGSHFAARGMTQPLLQVLLQSCQRLQQLFLRRWRVRQRH